MNSRHYNSLGPMLSRDRVNTALWRCLCCQIWGASGRFAAVADAERRQTGGLTADLAAPSGAAVVRDGHRPAPGRRHRPPILPDAREGAARGVLPEARGSARAGIASVLGHG